MKKEIPKEISKHFAELGKKSWESRKKAILSRVKKEEKLST
jgi:hypothetical protein